MAEGTNISRDQREIHKKNPPLSLLRSAEIYTEADVCELLVNLAQAAKQGQLKVETAEF